MTNQEILQIAMRQSAEDIGCRAEDFLAGNSAVVPYRPGEAVKKFYKPPISGHFVSYGNNLVAAATEDLLAIVEEYVEKFEFFHCFETPGLRWLNRRLEPLGQTVCFMSEYYLPDPDRLPDLPCPYELRVLEKGGFEELYRPEWSNALCSERSELDVLCVGAYDGGQLIGLAGCSADAERMWQIGVDVLPAYRRQGVASALTAQLAAETLSRGKAPFYCSAWSNIRSVRNAVRSGFLPAWVEMTIRPIETVDEINA